MDKTWVETKIPCPCGQSTDAFSIDSSGDGFCFSGYCEKPVYKGYSEGLEHREPKRPLTTSENIKFDHYPDRGLSEAVLRFYDIKTKFVDGEPFETGFTYHNGGVKIRSLKEKAFFSHGPMKEATLFGKDKYDPASKDSITLTEGEYDAASVAQMTRFETAAVSVRSSGQAIKDCSKEWEYINSFAKIIIAFDSDEAGQKAATQVAGLFDFKKVYHLKLNRHKDANAYLQAGEGSEFYKTWKNAKRYSPDNIINSFEDIKKSLQEAKEDEIGTYPIKKLQDALYGLHKGEVVVFKGGEGIGKTEIFRFMEHHLLGTTKHPIGIIHLEEDNGTTVKAIATYQLKEPAVLPDSGLSLDDILDGYQAAVDGDEDRVYIHSSFDFEDESAIIDNMRFLVSACGCKFIFLDHISWLATGNEGSQEDERKKLDRISQKLKLLVKELKFCLVMISHTNDNGQTRGSRNITKVANTVIHIDRDPKAETLDERLLTHYTIEKARLGGRTGPGIYAKFNVNTYCLEDYEPEKEAA